MALSHMKDDLETAMDRPRLENTTTVTDYALISPYDMPNDNVRARSLAHWPSLFFFLFFLF